jgi:hypothetical protein
VPFGRPWGVACEPIRFAVDQSVPKWAYTQIAAVVAQARKQRHLVLPAVPLIG